MTRRHISFLLSFCIIVTNIAVPAVAVSNTWETAMFAAAEYVKAQTTQPTGQDLLALYSAGMDESNGSNPAQEDRLAYILYMLTNNQNPHESISGLSQTLVAFQAELLQAEDIVQSIQWMRILPKVLPRTLIRADEFARWLETWQRSDGQLVCGNQNGAYLTALALPLLESNSRDEGFAYIEAQIESESGLSCIETATVISAYISCGRTVPDGLPERLLTFQSLDGSFVYRAQGETDAYATIAALTVLGELVTGKSVYNRLQGHYYHDVKALTNQEHKALRYVTEQGFLSGDGRGYFKPDVLVTRAEFAQVLYNFVDRFTTPAVLLDVPRDAWYAEVVGVVTANGLMMDGITDLRFKPYGNVTWLDAAIWLYQLLELDGRQAMDAVATERLQIRGLDSIPSDKQAAVASVVYEGLMSFDGDFPANVPLTRIEMAQIICRMIS